MKDEALKLAAEMERGQFSTTLLPAAAELRRLHEENQKLRAQLALDKMAENARELGLDYEPEQEKTVCPFCTSEWVTAEQHDRKMDRLDQEPVAYGMWDTMLGYGGRMMMVRLDKGQDGCTVPLYTAPAHQNVNVDDIGVPVGVGGWLTTTSSQPEQEPCCYGGIAHDCHAGKGCRIAERIKVTQKPPQRPSRSDIKPLTDEEIKPFCDANHIIFGAYTVDFVRAIEAAHGIKGEA